ncbi:galactose-3-O-sulfotransferase [Nitzschia inconspicua]|uniref:Galactose-3-O-sulfotransferase n=1 Tax=Nitzschia inconspicua TaxID=303405 RepID=A0A9K3KKU3_9STRA|nr:galactose-3-O-sulfotransferase [Nitzschia inconspicua]
MFQNMNGLADESLKLKTQMTVIDLNPEILHPYANSDSFNVSNVPTSTAIDLMGIRPRVWEPYPASRQLCFNPVKLRVARNSNNPFPVSSMPFDESFVAKRGILFLKPMKVGGSTASGINLRIAKNMAERLGRDYPLCDNNFDHAMGFMMSGRKRSESFLWTLLRDPTKRAISGFYHFDVSRYGVEPSLENFKAALSDQTDFYLRLHYFGRFPSQGNKKQKVKSANDIMKKYDFMAITERFDESMVILQMLLKAHNVTLGDLLYVKAKSNNGYDDGGHKGKCTFIRQAELTPEMKRFVSTKEWRKQIQWDNAFYAAANRSLDMTIDLLGRETVEKKVELYRWAQSLVKDRCAGEARLPCSNSGVKRQPNETNCLFSDSGCAYECLDAFVADELMQASDSESTTP